ASGEAVEPTRSSLPAESSTTTPSSPTRLTYAAVAALPPSSPALPSSASPADDAPARPASRASTRSVSSDESAEFHEYFADVMRRAKELGEEVSRLEADEQKEGEPVEPEKQAGKQKIQVENVERPVQLEVKRQEKEKEIQASHLAEGLVEEDVQEKAELSEADTEDIEVV
ncbi:hypothetical protein JCM8547_009270, partial [Rhodosporidiobolus lusitaniae]